MARADRFAGRCMTNTPAARFVDRTRSKPRPGCGCRRKIHPLHGRNQSAADVPGFEFTSTHSDAWGPDLGAAVDAGDRRRATGRRSLRSSTPSASRCNSSSGARAFCRRKRTFRRPSTRFAAAGWWKENFGEIESFEKTPGGVHELPPRRRSRSRKRHWRSWPAGRRTRPG